MSRPVQVISTGIANIASVLAGLRRAGAEPVIATSPAELARASHVMLPGVGAFGAGMARLHEMKMVEPLRERIAAGRPTLAICLGLQLLCESSEETPGVAGIGAVPGHVSRFGGSIRVPHFGWNRITPSAGCEMLRGGHAYFANSYRLSAAPAGWLAATCHYDGPFVAAIERGGVLACQFHPELSGDLGAALLTAWVAREGR